MFLVNLIKAFDESLWDGQNSTRRCEDLEFGLEL